MSDVDKDEVAKYYIQCELDNIIVGDNIRLRDDAYSTDIPRLLEALSFTYRANSVFDYVEGGQSRWEKREVSIDDIVLTGMGEDLTEIIYGDQVQRNPRKFVEYIKSHQDDERLTQISSRHVSENRKTMILREDDGKLKMLDGSHRFLSMVMNGATSVSAYIAILADKSAKPMIGDTIFLRLRKLWEQTQDPVFKSSIEQTVLGMLAETENGASSVEAYWVSMAPNEELRLVGQRLINKFNS